MVRVQFGFKMQFPSGTPEAYGIRSRFTVPSGIPTLASNGDTGARWFAVGNLWTRLENLARFVESSLTYVAVPADMNHPSVTQVGWYFWYAHLDNVGNKLYENYIRITYDPVGNIMQFSLHNNNTKWYATIDNQTRGTITAYEIIGTPNAKVAKGSGPSPMMFMEGNTNNCAHYTSFNQLPFTKFKYLDFGMNETSQNPSVVTPNLDPGIPCVIVDASTRTIRHS